MKNISAKKISGKTKLNLEDDQLLEIVIKLRDLNLLDDKKVFNGIVKKDDFEEVKKSSGIISIL